MTLSSLFSPGSGYRKIVMSSDIIDQTGGKGHKNGPTRGEIFGLKMGKSAF